MTRQEFDSQFAATEQSTDWNYTRQELDKINDVVFAAVVDLDPDGDTTKSTVDHVSEREFAKVGAARWYEFTAYNTQKIYGFGTAEEADRYEDILNEGRSINHYASYAVDAETAATLDSNTEAFDLGDELRARAEA